MATFTTFADLRRAAEPDAPASTPLPKRMQPRGHWRDAWWTSEAPSTYRTPESRVTRGRKVGGPGA